ncbi:MAG: ABC transporter permease [Xanthobacteraceae bacterium]|jgi:NitT/TauT family transport system permease protein
MASIEVLGLAQQPSKAVRLLERIRNRPELVLVPAFAFILFGGWEYCCRALKISELIVPAPSKIVLALVDGFASGYFLVHLAATVEEIVLGFLIAAIAAFVIGTLISQIRLLEVVIYPYIVALQTLPKVALAPLILIWVGLGIEGKVLVAATISFFPMLVNTIAGLKYTPKNEIDLMRSLSASRWKIFRYVQLPEALPFIFAGLNIGLVLSVLGAIVGEFVGAKVGLGYLILQMNFNLDVAGMFAVLVVLGFLGIVFNGVAQYLRRKIVFWQPEGIG